MIKTERLILRPFKHEDYKDVFECCNDYDVVKTTLGMPWPYTEEMAQGWIAKHEGNRKSGLSCEFAICYKQNPEKVIGCVSLVNINPVAKRAELGYWVGKKYWKQGIATEASVALMEYGFNELNLNSIFARFFDINPASGKVMQKCGMNYVGKMRQHEFRFDKFYDVVYYEILKEDFISKYPTMC